MKEKYKQDLNKTFNQFGADNKSHSLLNADIYRVPFVMALDLIRGRKVFILNGKAFVPHNDIIVVICGAFRSHLSEALSVTSIQTLLVHVTNI